MTLVMGFFIWLSGEENWGKVDLNDLRRMVGGVGNKIDLRQLRVPLNGRTVFSLVFGKSE